MEEYLARTCPADTVRLVFSRNAPSVIIGRNQNPWAEADLREAFRREVVIARRASGGGTVYHDPGNLNYGFIMPRLLYSPPRFLAIVVTALRRLGLEASACNRSSIWIGERKVSGTAFLLTGRTALLHGCVLVDSDLGDLRRILTAPDADLHSRAIPSVRSPVVRLRDLRPDLGLDAVREGIAASAAGALLPVGAEVTQEPMPATAAAAPVLERLSSWEWIYGRTAEFEHVLRLPDGEVALVVREARVAEARVAGDTAGSQALTTALAGVPYDGQVLAAALVKQGGIPAARCDALAACLRQRLPALRPPPPVTAGNRPSATPGR